MGRRRYVYADPCAATDQCHHWPRYDDRCHRNTEPHSTMCSEHQDRDQENWHESHTADDCCQAHCRGEETHE